ncbi:hypothetical protein HQ403_02635 [Candidatus Kaiserbacteria bacterium]|nr:hypothetical protein [Candidatus Kaiserbacteria bacterium]
METLIHADIFFFITSIAVVVVTIALCIVTYFAFKAFRVLKEIGEIVRDEAKLIKEDIDGARNTIRTNTKVINTIIKSVAGMGSKKKKTSSTERNK